VVWVLWFSHYGAFRVKCCHFQGFFFFFGQEIGLGPLVFSLFGLIFCFYLAYLVEFSSFLCVPLTEWVKFEIFGHFFINRMGEGKSLVLAE
jgi:hypothetical protein